MQQGHKSILIQAPTGAGKTALTAAMLKTAASKGLNCWFIVHRRELVEQSAIAFHKIGLHHGIVCSGYVTNYLAPVQIASIQTLARCHNKIKAPQLIVWDEAHHQMAASWEKIRQTYKTAFHVGLSATPCRLDGKGLNKYFDKMIQGPSVSWLIKNGYLSDYKLFAPTVLNTEGLHKKRGEYDAAEVDQLVNVKAVVGDVVSHYKKFASGKRAIAFCASISHSKNLCDQLIGAGIRAEHLDGTISREERMSTLKRFRDGTTTVLTNVDLFGEGFDCPGIEAVLLCRPTASISLSLQQIGRALRPAAEKTHAIILDHVGNYKSHGLPDDDREWSLDDGIVKKKSDGPSVTVCRNCFAANNSKDRTCVNCGAQLKQAGQKREQIKQVEGNLEEIDREAMRRKSKKEQASAQTEADLIELGKQRGYKRPHLWARHVIRARGGR